MFGTLDRYILRCLLVNYLIALSVMMGLYVVFDLFVNIDEFAEESSGTTMIAGIFSFYGYNLFKYFAQLSGVITLFACLFTVARLRRQNELVALLASGVSLYRVAAPAIIFGAATTGFWLLNAEVITPMVADHLARPHDDPFGKRAYDVHFMNDGDNHLLSGREFIPGSQRIRGLMVLERNDEGKIVSVLEADEANWVEDPKYAAGGVWQLKRGVHRVRSDRPDTTIGPTQQQTVEYVNQYESKLAPKDVQMRQASNWTRYLSSVQLKNLQNLEHVNNEQIRQIRHERLATPLINVVMLLLGIPFILRRDPGNLIGDAAKCLGICGLCYVVSIGATNINPEGLPALPSWLPIIIFTPLAAVLMDRIRT